MLVGVTGGLACLTRITALSFLVPALVWIVLAAKETRREHLARAPIAFGMMALIVAPYLINCAISMGDPFIAINYHTTYYRFAEGLSIGQPMSAGQYIREKFAHHPIGTLDNGAIGLFVHPFATKWNGLDVWLPHLRSVMWWSALAGLAMWPFTARGRLLLVLLVSSLLPYAFTWNVGGGGQWRFTMHVYSVYVIAAAQAWIWLLSPWWRAPLKPLARRAVTVAAIGLIGVVLFTALPWYVVRENIANGEAANVEPGDRDWVFYRRGWVGPRRDGAVLARVSDDTQTTVHFPLPAVKPYDIVLRIDPVAPEIQQRVTVLFNRQLLGTLRFSWNPDRVGSYTLSLPPAWMRAGDNEITLVPDTLVAAGTTGPRYAWIDPAEKIGVRVWYLRVLD